MSISEKTNLVANDQIIIADSESNNEMKTAKIGNLPVKTNGWELANTWTFSTNVPSVSFNNLGDYDEIMIMYSGITLNPGTYVSVSVSSDNGNTFINKVKCLEGNNSNIEIRCSSPNNVIYKNGYVKIENFNKNLFKPILGTVWSSSILGLNPSHIESNTSLNSIKVSSLTGNITAGKIYVYGKK